MPLINVPPTPPSSAICWSLLKSMQRIRSVEERIAQMYPSQKMRCPVHLSIGQEAPAAAFGTVLEQHDLAMSSHRSHAHYLAKGGDLTAMVAEMHGKATGCSKGRGGSMHLTDVSAGFTGAVPIVGSTISIATGLAFASKLAHKSQVTVVFFGEGAAEEGVFHESINFAMLHKLPIIYACENNLYSVYTPLHIRQPQGRTLCEIASSHGLLALPVDGNDALASHSAAHLARQTASSGAGPVFIEFATYRWREHCGPNWDNDLGYRSEQEFTEWQAQDPLPRLQKTIADNGWQDKERHASIIHNINEEIRMAFQSAEAAPYPHPDSLMDYCLA